MEWLKLADFGLSFLLVGGLYLLILYGGPKFLRERRIQREDEMKAEAERRGEFITVLKMFGERIVTAQERQAEAMQKMADVQSRHDSDSSRCMDDLQIALGGVAQHVNNLHGDVSQQREVIIDVKQKVDELADRIGDKLDRILARG